MRVVLKSINERILQFHRLIVLMNIDHEQHNLEIGRLHVLGLSMGLRPSIIIKMIEEMNNYLNGMIPYKTLIHIHEKHKN